MSLYCHYCDYEDTVGPEEEVTREHTIRGETFEITYTLFECPKCYTNWLTNDDPAKLLFEKYREKHGLLKPEEITKIREAWSLSELAFADQLGIEASTLHRYEGGGLQTLEDDARIRLYEPPWHVGLVNDQDMEFTYHKGVRQLWVNAETPVRFDITGPGNITGVFFSTPQGDPWSQKILRFRWKTDGIIESIAKVPCDKGDILELYLTREAVLGLGLTVHWKLPKRGELTAFPPGRDIVVTHEVPK